MNGGRSSEAQIIDPRALASLVDICTDTTTAAVSRDMAREGAERLPRAEVGSRGVEEGEELMGRIGQHSWITSSQTECEVWIHFKTIVGE